MPRAGRAPVRVASVPAAPAPQVAAGRARPVTPAPSEPPPALAAAPDLFVELPILRHMEKLAHYEAIQTTTLDEGPAGTGVQQGDSG